MSASHLKHRHGGTITTVHAVGHETVSGVAEWFFLGDVQWNDGTVSKRTRIAPFALGHDSTPEGNVECAELHGALTDYLSTEGQWHDMKHKRDGRAYSWTPHRPKGERQIAGVPA